MNIQKHTSQKAETANTSPSQLSPQGGKLSLLPLWADEYPPLPTDSREHHDCTAWLPNLSGESLEPKSALYSIGRVYERRRHTRKGDVQSSHVETVPKQMENDAAYVLVLCQAIAL